MLTFERPRARTLRSILLCGTLASGLSACATPIYAIPAACSSLIPDSWRKPVDGAPLPGGNAVGDWIAFGDAQTGKLEIAIGRTADVIGLEERCEQRDSAAAKHARGKLLGIIPR